MDLTSLLRNQVKQALDAVVHIGAGANANTAQYEGIDFQRVVLVEANPQACDKLRRIFSPDPRFIIQEAFLADSVRQEELHIYNLDLFSGPHKWEPSEQYPRLLREKTLSVQALGLNAFISSLALDREKCHALLLDTPGQEAPLLSSLSRDDLGLFSYILFSSTTMPLQSQSEGLDSATRTLEEKGYRLLKHTKQENPLWPCFMFEADLSKRAFIDELDHRAQLLVAKATQIHQQTEQINALTAERDDLATRLSSLESEHSDLVTRHTSLATEREALQGHHSTLDSTLSTLTAEHSELVTRHSSLVAERDDLATRHQQLATEREALQSDLTTKSTLLDVLTAGRIAQDKQMEKLLQEQNSLISERDALASRVSDLMSQVEKLEAHAKLIDEEFDKAEGQIELIKDIFLREAIR
jgi:DNA repair exonuclease SbcCD ATPase subunit